jgi:phosphopantetheinyl transferase
LCEAERARAASFKVPKRQNDWLIGRLNLKALLVALLEARYGQRCPPSHLHIARKPSGAPAVQLAAEAPPTGRFRGGARLPLSVSNSHSQGAALGAALWADALESWGWRAAVGADLEWIEPRSEGFVRDFLTEPERRYCAAGGDERHLRANLVWSAKEAVLKVLPRGLSADTWWLTCLPAGGDRGPDAGPPALQVIAQPEEGRWRPFSVSCDDRLGAAGVEFGGVWRAIDGYVATIAVGIRRG